MTSDVAKGRTKGPVLNVPNQLTSARLVLAVILFVFLARGYYTTSLILFIIAASTDWIDGYWARKYGQVTVLGRILDPFADKMIICGTFIFLAAAGRFGCSCVDGRCDHGPRAIGHSAAELHRRTRARLLGADRWQVEDAPAVPGRGGEHVQAGI